MSLEDWKFCGNCDYVMSGEEHAALKVDVPCPRCGKETAHWFYSHGSKMHKHRRQGYLAGELVGNPPPFPQENDDDRKTNAN